MIETSQLRIGNYLSLGGSLAKVAAVHNGYVCLEGQMRETDNPNCSFEYNPVMEGDVNLNPIELSDLRLQMLVGSFYTGRVKPFLFRPSKSTYLIYPDTEKGGYFVGLDYRGHIIHITARSIYTLHDLQNVYHSVYGEELPIDENKVRLILRH